MREHMPHHAGNRRHAIPLSPARRGESIGALRGPRSHRNPPTMRWSALRSCRRAGPSPGAFAPGHSRRRGARRKRRRGAKRLRVSACGAGMSRRRRAQSAAQLSFHGQSAQAGFFGEQMVAPRSIMACAKSPARRCGVRRAQAAAAGLAAGSGVLNGKEPRDDALDIAVDRACRHVESDRRDGGRRVIADARQRAQARLRSPGTRRRDARPRHARRRADCGRAHNSRARPRLSARHRAAPPQARARPASAQGNARNKARPPAPWSVAA